MMLLTLAFTLLASTGHTAPGACGPKLDSTRFFKPSDAHRERLIERILSRSGPDKFFAGVDQGNRGMHAYMIPHDRAEHLMDVLGQFLGKDLGGLREAYDPEKNMLVGVLETEDEPLISVILMVKDWDRPYGILPRKFNAVYGEDNARLRELVPSAWSEDGDYDHFKVTHDLLKDAEEVPLPWSSDRVVGTWTIENYK